MTTAVVLVRFVRRQSPIDITDECLRRQDMTPVMSPTSQLRHRRNLAESVAPRCVDRFRRPAAASRYDFTRDMSRHADDGRRRPSIARRRKA